MTVFRSVQFKITDIIYVGGLAIIEAKTSDDDVLGYATFSIVINENEVDDKALVRDRLLDEYNKHLKIIEDNLRHDLSVGDVI